ncbi:hypothetical protein GIB67_033684 [Kingdonia uniflora]|uniref:Glycosyltransferase n=1 Tax=Kingdonia uniflora TaxID=39325 RepID=A0A7J7P4F1_9MAGN|nr:hypothetical protein GIB67_033684 [Kingdonia uniflora]
MEKERRVDGHGGHVVLLPFPAQGHMNPLLQIGKLLTTKGLKVTLATTIFLSKSIHIKPTDVGIETISDGFDETGLSTPEGFQAYFKRFKEVGSQTLANLIKNHENSCNPISCLVYDSLCPWAIDVAKGFGLIGAIFFTTSISAASIHYHAYNGMLKAPVLDQPTIFLHGLPPLSPSDLPSSLHVAEESSSKLDVLSSRFSTVKNADYVLFNTFDKLESEAVSWMKQQFPHVKTIGPSIYLDKQNKCDKDHSISLFKPSENSYMEWLNTRESESVIYMSFGSVVPLSKEQMEELAWGLRDSGKNFLWVVKETEEMKLPLNFIKETSNKGLVVKWCSQMEVLAHEAIGCFITHCGWNSILEGLSMGVPLVAMPMLWDQPLNAKFVEDVWGVGIRTKMNDKGLVGREELLFCIREVMQGDRRKAIQNNVSSWKTSAKDAMDIGGSSYANIEEVVARLRSI